MKKLLRNGRTGQTVLEYLMLVGLIAIVFLTVCGFFSDTQRRKIAGVITSLTSGHEASSAQSDVQDLSEKILMDIDKAGTDGTGGSGTGGSSGG
ncbi:MAG: hypothetical protein WCS96_04875 [Victivallales bacterium]